MELNIVYTINNTNQYSAYVSMQSLFENNKNNIVNLNIIHDETLEDKFLNLFLTFKNFDNCKSLKFFKCNSQSYRKFYNEYGSLYLFEFANQTNLDKFLYIFGASLITDDLSELYSTNLENYSCACTEFQYAWEFNIKFCNDFVFTNYAMLINANKFKEKKYFKKLFSNDFYNHNNIHKKTHLELHVFNLLIDDCKKIDPKYGYTERWYSNKNFSCSNNYKDQYKKFLLHLLQPSIIIFLSKKPYNNGCKHSYSELWWKYAEKSAIYEEMKELRNSNKYKLTTTSAQNSFNYVWLLSRIMPYIRPYWFRILVGFLIAIPLGLLDGVTAFALKPYMDYVIGGKAFEFNYHGLNISITSLQMAWILPIGVIAFAAIQGVLRYLNGYCSTWTSQRITNDVKFDLFKRLINMHPQFFDDNSSGVVISRYMGDPKTASAGIVDNIKTITTSLCGALGLIAVMLYSSWKLAFIGVLVLCIAFIPVILIRNRIKEASNKNMVIGSNITTNINETYSGNKIMTAYKLQDRQNKYFVEQTWKSFNINMSLYKRAGWMSPMMYLIASCGIATVLGVGTYLINSGQMTAGAFASFVTSLLLLYKPVKTLGNTLTGIQNIFVAMGRVFELFDLTPAIKDCENPKTLTELKSGIDFENVDFEYIPNKPVLKNLNLHIVKNETLAIVGNSGGGKSTLVNLLPRFYDIKSGSIKFDGVDIREYSLDSLRENISMVFQDNFLYSGTIKENIMMGNPNATTDELMQAIKSAHLEEMIQELPEGLETELGERGLTLSGGQRQRVAIARAMLRNAPIVILDEATSALDNESEAIVQKAMDNLMKDRTVFIIAHRLSTIKNADRIAVINEGELVELGTHEELMNIENGQYKALYEMQFKKQAVNI